MKRRIEKKLRQSLEVILPNESLSLPTIHSTFKWSYLFISILVISSILLLERPIVYFNQGIPVMMNTVKMFSVEEQLIHGRNRTTLHTTINNKRNTYKYLINEVTW